MINSVEPQEAEIRNLTQCESHVLVIGVLRNCAKTIASDVANITAALSDFRSVRWFVVESDSDDQSVMELQRLSNASPNFRHTSLGRLGDRLKLRSERVAASRNRCLDELTNYHEYADVDFVVIVDLDNINGLLKSEAVATCFSRKDWDACMANQAGPYYDLWALRQFAWQPGDCWEQYRFLKNIGLTHDEAFYQAVYSRMQIIPQTSSWIEVDSAFGGFAIYRRKAIEGCRYAGTDEHGIEICEHVPFHAQMRARGHRLFINPSLINVDWSEHTEILRPAARMKIELRRARRLWR